MRIEDGKGLSNYAEVNDEQQLVVHSISAPELVHFSEDLGAGFSWDSTELNIDATDTMLFVKNTGSENLLLDRTLILGSNVVCTWEILIGALTTTPVGATVTPINLNETFSSKVAEASALSDETAVADGSLIARVKTGVDETFTVDMRGIILGKNHYIQFNQVTESTRGSVIIFGHFH